MVLVREVGDALTEIFLKFAGESGALTRQQLDAFNISVGQPPVDDDVFEYIEKTYGLDEEGRLSLDGFLRFFDDMGQEQPQAVLDIVQQHGFDRKPGLLAVLEALGSDDVQTSVSATVLEHMLVEIDDALGTVPQGSTEHVALRQHRAAVASRLKDVQQQVAGGELSRFKYGVLLRERLGEDRERSERLASLPAAQQELKKRREMMLQELAELQEMEAEDEAERREQPEPDKWTEQDRRELVDAVRRQVQEAKKTQLMLKKKLGAVADEFKPR